MLVSDTELLGLHMRMLCLIPPSLSRIIRWISATTRHRGTRELSRQFIVEKDLRDQPVAFHKQKHQQKFHESPCQRHYESTVLSMMWDSGIHVSPFYRPEVN
jgi:hypothetical protein